MALMAKSESIWFRFRGLFAAAVLVPVALLAVISRPVLASGSWPDIVVGSTGWACFLVGIGTRYWSTLYLGGRKGHMVVSDGPYSICRNPLYVGSLFLSVSAALLFRSLSLAAAVVVAALIYAMGAVPAEERFLRKEHGETFDRYCAAVPRFVPKFAGFQTPEVIEVKVKGLRTELRRSLIWIWIPIAADALSHLRGASWWPTFLPLP